MQAIQYEAIILEAFRSGFCVAAASGHHTVIRDCLTISMRYHSFLFFANQTQELLEPAIFHDPKLRDFIYSLLVRLKFGLNIEGAHLSAIVDVIANTGYELNTYTVPVIEGKIELSAAQVSFDAAYVSDVEDRKAILYRYEWGIVIFLMQMYFQDLKTIFNEVLKEYPPSADDTQ